MSRRFAATDLHATGLAGWAEAADAPCPTVSALIPAYNAAGTIERALNSVYAQTYRNIIEVIVVDDGSTDGTAEVVREKFPNATVVEQENAGQAAATNVAAARARGSLLALLDADDEWLPEKIRTQVAYLIARPGLGLVTCRHVVGPPGAEDPAHPSAAHLEFLAFRDRVTGRPQAERFTLSNSGWLVTSDCYHSVGGLDEDLECCIDLDFLVRVSAAGYGIGGVPERLLTRHLQPVSVSRGPGSRLKRARMNLRIWRKYDPHGSSTMCRLLSEAEFNTLIRKQLIAVALAHGQCGNAWDARALAHEARTLPGATWRTRLVTWAISVWPALAARLHGLLGR